MKLSGREEYWLDTLECALDEVDLFGTIPQDKLERIASILSCSAENMSLAYPTPENPLIHENNQLKRKIDEVRKEDERLLLSKIKAEQDVTERWRMYARDLEHKLEKSQ